MLPVVANLAAAADARSPARTSRTTDRSSTSTDVILINSEPHVKIKMTSRQSWVTD